jgi:hypothetical protein
MRLKAGGNRQRFRVGESRSSSVVMREEGFKILLARTILFYKSPEKILRKNIKLQECKAIAIFSDLANINYIRARILRQSKFNEYRIIDKKVGDDHRS